MALRVVTMAELRRDVLLQPERSGESVAEVCRRHGISRQTYYRYRRRYLLEGLDGLEDRSREPVHQPARMGADLEIEICRMRKDHPGWGARRISAELARAGIDPPAVSTIHRALVRNHLVALQPPQRPRALRRFERELSSDLWQIDATQIRLSGRSRAWVMDMIDDHSRYLLAATAADRPTGEAAWDCFELAAARYGLPRQVLSDNGLCFTGRLHGVEVEFERGLRELGVEPINAGPYHPHTLGKLERFHTRPSRPGLPRKDRRETCPTYRSSWTAFATTTTASVLIRGSATSSLLNGSTPLPPFKRCFRAWAMTSEASRSPRHARSFAR